MVALSEFSKKVIEVIQAIPPGKVATYKQIAELAKKPQAARGVSWILHSCSTRYKLPWHRVLNAQGKIAFEKGTHNYRKQKKLLQNEGVVFHSEDQLSLKDYQWTKRVRLKSSKNTPKLFSSKAPK